MNFFIIPASVPHYFNHYNLSALSVHYYKVQGNDDLNKIKFISFSLKMNETGWQSRASMVAAIYLLHYPSKVVSILKVTSHFKMATVAIWSTFQER